MRRLFFSLLCLLLLASCASILGSDSDRFIANGDGTVLDEETGLMWAAADNGMNLSWRDAKDFCDTFAAGGYHDWRMPKIEELSALFEAGVRKGEKKISIREYWIWAQETENGKGAYCSFKLGNCGWAEEFLSFAMRALPVRDTRGGTEASVASDPSLPPVRPQTVQQRLQVLELLHKQQLVSREEYDRKRAEILDGL